MRTIAVLAVFAAMVVLPAARCAGGNEAKKEAEKTPAAAAAPEVGIARDKKPSKLPIEEKLESRRVSFLFQDTPITKALDHVADLTETNFIVDIPKEKDVKVNLRVNKMTMENALHWLAKLADVQFCVVEDAVYFGNKPANKKILKVYNIKDLLHPAKDFPGPQLKTVTDDDDGNVELPEAIQEEDKGVDPEVIVRTIKEVTGADGNKPDEGKKTGVPDQPGR